MSSSPPKPLPSPAEIQSQFEQSITLTLHTWPTLTYAVQESWGGPDSADKRDWFAGAISDLFPDLFTNPAALQALQSPPALNTTTTTSTTNTSTTIGTAAAARNGTATKRAEKTPEEPDALDLEQTILQIMLDEFHANLDDDSALPIAEQILRLRTLIARGNFSELEDLRRKFDAKKGQKVAFHKGAEQGSEDEWEDDDSEEDYSDDGEGDRGREGNGDVKMDEAPPPVRKTEPEVDDDGFTMVTRKKR